MMRKMILAPILALTILLLVSPILLTTIGDGMGSESYAVLEDHTFILSVVNSAGGRAVVYQFATQREADLQGIAMDSSGNYIVTLGFSHILAKITPAGVMTVIYDFPEGSFPGGLAIDSSGNYIVSEGNTKTLSKITPAGVRTVICTFPEGSGPGAIAIDSSGNYIVCEADAGILSKVTPTGQRTVIYTYASNPDYITSVAIDSSGNYIVCEIISYSDNPILSKITPDGVRTTIYNFTITHTWPVSAVIDSSGNYIVCEAFTHILSKITPAGERTVIYSWLGSVCEPWGVCMYVSAAPQIFLSDATQNSMTVTWTQSTDPFFAGYQIYQSSAQGEIGTLIGTNSDIADTSLAVTGLSPGTTYYFTLRVLGANGAYVESGQGSGMTAKAFWQQDWFPYVVVLAILAIVVIALAIILPKRLKKTS